MSSDRKQRMKFKESIRQIKINSVILDFDKYFFSRSLSSRRSVLHNLLISDFNIEVAYLGRTYKQFVELFNDQYQEESDTEYINRLPYTIEPPKEKKKEPQEEFYFESEPETDYTIRGDTSDEEY